MKYFKVYLVLSLFFCLKGFGQISAINESNFKIEASTSSLKLNEIKIEILKNHITSDDFVSTNLLKKYDFDRLNYYEIILLLKTTQYEIKDEIHLLEVKKSKLQPENKDVEEIENEILLLNKDLDFLIKIIKAINKLDKELNYDPLLKSKNKEFNTEIENLEEKLSNASSVNSSIKLKNQIVKIKEKKSSFIKDYNRYKNDLLKIEKWMPSKNKFYRSYFFENFYGENLNNTSFLNSLALINSSGSNIVSSELVADNLGSTRISFGTSVLINDDSKVEDTNDTKNNEGIEKLINQGGNFYLDVSLPIYATNDSDYYTFYGFINAKTAMDIKGFDSDIRNSGFNASIGGKLYGSLSSDNKKFVFSLLIDSNLYYGSRELFENLNINKQILFNTNLTAYITISNNYRVALRTNFASHPNLRTERIAFGLQLLK